MQVRCRVSRSSSFGVAQLRPGSSSLRRYPCQLRNVYGLTTDRSSRDDPFLSRLQPLRGCQCYGAMPLKLCAPPKTVQRGRAACAYATESTPRLSRAERRRRDRAEKKGRPLPPLPAKPGVDDDSNKYTGGKVELKGVTDLGIFKAIKHNVSCVCRTLLGPVASSISLLAPRHNRPRTLLRAHCNDAAVSTRSRYIADNMAVCSLATGAELGYPCMLCCGLAWRTLAWTRCSGSKGQGWTRR